MQATLIAFCLGLASCCALAQRPAAAPLPSTALKLRIAAMIADPAAARAHWGVAVAAMDGSSIASINAGQLFQPASNNKLFTTAAAMALLGPAATVETQVVQHGTLANGTLIGDLALVGAGDANFAGEDLPYLPPAAAHARHQAEARPGSAEAIAKAEREAHPLRQMEVLADAIVAAGVRHVTGDVVGDDTRFPWEPYPEAWGIDDVLWGYGAPVSALTIHDNQILLRVRPGASAGMPASVELERSLPMLYTVDAANLRTTAAHSGTHLSIDRRATEVGRSRELRVWGTIAADADEDVELIAIDDPAEFAAEALKELLQARGVTVSGAARAKHRLPLATKGFQAQVHELSGSLALVHDGPHHPDGADSAAVEPVLASVFSPVLADDVLLTNKISQNLHAELLLSRLAAGTDPSAANPVRTSSSSERPALLQTEVDAGSRAQGARVVRAFLERSGINREDFVFFDGSGLSTHDLVTPRATVTLLTWVSSQPWFAAWKASLPVGGIDGSLATRFREPSLTGHVVAKTGTLGEARALSGYLQCASGRVLAFSIMVDNHSPGSSAEREVMDRIVGAIYATE